MIGQAVRVLGALSVMRIIGAGRDTSFSAQVSCAQLATSVFAGFMYGAAQMDAARCVAECNKRLSPVKSGCLAGCLAMQFFPWAKQNS